MASECIGDITAPYKKLGLAPPNESVDNLNRFDQKSVEKVTEELNTPIDTYVHVPLTASNHKGAETAISMSKLESIKQALDRYLRSNNVYGEIRKLVGEFLQHENLDFSGEDKVLAALHERGIISDIIRSLGAVKPSLQTRPKLMPNRRYLIMRVNKGRAFVETLLTDGSTHQSMLAMFLHFQDQRYCSKAVVAEVAPEFKETFVFNLQEPNSTKLLTVNGMIVMKSPIHVVLTREDRYGHRVVIATQIIEWRKVVVHGKLNLCVELYGQEEGLRAPVGMLDVDFELVPLPKNPDHEDLNEMRPVFVEQEIVVRQLNEERSERMRQIRKFHSYARTWWNEYVQIRPNHQTRVVKMFATDEENERRFVCTFVTPLQAGRLLESPLHAARFVRLIPCESVLAPGGEKSNIWQKVHTMLCKGYGDVEDHAILLCSLLLGFGLEAFVCVGKDREGPSLWVMTKGDHGSVTLWDSVRGQRYSLSTDQPTESKFDSMPFRSVACVFSHNAFYGNIQADNSIGNVAWDFSDDTSWKSLSKDSISTLPRCSAVSLYPSSFDPIEAASVLEARLRYLITGYRRNHWNVSTEWDDHLSYILGPALAAYESQVTTGVSFGNAEFQQAVKNTIPLNHVFKGFPFQFDHRNADRILAQFVQSGKSLEILQSRGTDVHFAIRAKIVQYPEGISAVWVILAVRFLSST